MQYANNKGADQYTHPRSVSAPLLFAASIVQYLYLLNPKFQDLASLCSWAGWFESYLVANPNYRFSRDVAQIYFLHKTSESPHLQLVIT